MNFFRINDDKTSYFFSILKLILAIIFIVLPIVISFNCHFNDRSLEVLTQIIGFCVLIWGFFNVYIVIGEFACVAENRKKSKLTDNFNKLKIYIFSFENICSLLLNNEICDIYIILNNKVVNIGCSSIYNKKMANSQISDTTLMEKNIKITQRSNTYLLI